MFLLADKVRRVQVLLVEDDEADQKLFARALKRSSFDYNLEIVREPEAFLTQEYLKKLKKFDVIFLDYHFPAGVSSNLLHLLKKHWGLDTPVILFTGTESQTLKENSEAYNKVYYQTKCEEVYNEIPEIILRVTQGHLN